MGKEMWVLCIIAASFKYSMGDLSLGGRDRDKMGLDSEAAWPTQWFCDSVYVGV